MRRRYAALSSTPLREQKTSMDRRRFVRRSGGLVGAALLAPRLAESELAAPAQQPGPLAALQPLPPVPPITDAERRGRIEKARRLMTENGIDAIFLEGGTSMFYFTGVRWGNSERPFGVVIPGEGRARLGHAGLRGGARARADQVLERRPRLAGRREPVRGDRRDSQRPRRGDRARSASRSASASSSSTACARQLPQRSS